jgi:RHS repeat-associated protein
MLVKVIRPDKCEVSFGYDALGRRLWKKFNNTVTKWLWDGNVPLHEWKEHAHTGEKLGNGTVREDGVITWIFEVGSFIPVGKIKGSKKYSIIADHLGTPYKMYQEDGSKFWECELDSYGKVRMLQGEMGSCPFRFQGQYEDVETGLYYNRFRYYAKDEGIYISQDPIRLNGGFELYNYVDDPNTCIDPFGLAKAKCHKSGDKGRKQAKKDIEAAGLMIIGEEVTLSVKDKKKGSGNIKADFVAVDPKTGEIHVFEAKNGSSSFTDNQTAAKVFDENRLSNTDPKGGPLDLSQGKTQGASVATGNTTKTNDMKQAYTDATKKPAPSFGKGSTHNPTFHTLWYDK